MSKEYQDKSFLYDRYIVKKLTIDKIAEECGVTPMTIFNNLKKHDLIKNSRTLGTRSVGGNSKGKKGFYG